MATVYWIGVLAGAGVALGLLAAGLLATGSRGVLAAPVLAAAAGAGIGLAAGDWQHALGAAIGGLLGAFGAGQVVRGALGRGGTRGGTALLLGGAALLAAALAFVPLVGYLEALAVPAAALRARRHAGERYAGLRVLARD